MCMCLQCNYRRTCTGVSLEIVNGGQWSNLEGGYTIYDHIDLVLSLDHAKSC